MRSVSAGEADDDAPIEMNGAGERQIAGDLTPEQFDGGLAEEQSEDAADAAEQQAFDDGLLQQARAAGAQRGADGLFAHTRNGAGQHETGDVEAGQRPDAEDHGVEQHQRLANPLIERLLIPGDRDAGSNGAVGGLFGDDCLGASELIV